MRRLFLFASFCLLSSLILAQNIRVSDDAEILIRGDGVFAGYHKDVERTRQVLTNGWYHTGDAGHINDHGHLIFMDRLGDLGELKGGHKYAPAYIEGKLKFSPYIKESVVIGGAERVYPSCIINIDFDTVGKWAEKKRIPYTTFVDLSQKEEVAELIGNSIDNINRFLPEWSQLRKFVLLHKEFDPDEAEMTRTRKVRRAFLEGRYKELIDAVYQDREDIIVEAQVKYRDGRSGVVRTPLRIRSVRQI